MAARQESAKLMESLTSALGEWKALPSPAGFEVILELMEKLPALARSFTSCEGIESASLIEELIALVSGQISEQQAAKLHPDFSAAVKDFILHKSELCSPGVLVCLSFCVCLF
jgi:hypothetical protein